MRKQFPPVVGTNREKKKIVVNLKNEEYINYNLKTKDYSVFYKIHIECDISGCNCNASSI